ncbi:MAG: hypothetical protein ACR2KV_03095 [Solirubrobacteraceae bacterium]
MRGRSAIGWRLALAGAAGALCSGALAGPAIAFTATAQPPAPTEGAAFKGTVATFVDGFGLLGCPPTSMYTASIAWGDGTTTAGIVGGGIGQLLGGGGCLFAVDGGHTYAEDGPVNYAVTISSGSATGQTGATLVPVRDASLSAAATSFTAAQGAPAAATVATFADDNRGATPADFTASVAWGDGTSGPGTAAAGPHGGFAVTATHTYAHTGSFSVMTLVKDAGGSQAGVATTATVQPTAPGQPPSQPTPMPPAQLRLGLSPPVLARGGTVVIGLRCPVAARLCRGRLNVATVASPKSRLVLLRRAQPLGTTLFIIPGGRRAELSVRPKRSLVAVLRQAGTVTVAAYASSFDAATGRSQVASLTAKLKLAHG